MPPTRKKPATRSPWHFPSSYWFPVAALYAAFILPWSILGQLGLVTAPPGLRHGLGHAHEMLFGFALATVAGYTLTPSKGRQPMALLTVWAAARLGSLFWPGSVTAAICNSLFVGGLAWLVAPLYLRASKWRNRSVAIIILALALTVLAFQAVNVAALAAMGPMLLHNAVLLLSALMFFMGGRILAPAIAGHVRRQGPPLTHVVQGALEGSVLVLLAVAMVAGLLPWLRLQQLSGLLLWAGAALTGLRLLRWRPWLCRDRPDLLALLAGYLWLIIGWVLLGGSLLSGQISTAALHAITVGALGTLTFSVMLRTQMFRSTANTRQLSWAHAGALAMAAAALLRISGGPRWTLLASAACWSACYLGLVLLLVHLQRQKKN